MISEKNRYKAAAELCAMFAVPAVNHILNTLEQGEASTRALVTDEYKEHTVLKYLRLLCRSHIVRKESLGSSVTYKLRKEHYARLKQSVLAIGDIID